VVIKVAPAVLSSELGGDITIHGSNFCMRVRVDFASDGIELFALFEVSLVSADENRTTLPLANVHWRDAGSLTANVPPGASLGSHALRLTIPDGRIATLENAVLVLDRLTGAECTTDADCLDDPCATHPSCTDGQCIHDKDADGDGYVDAACGGYDCDDTSSSVYHGSACDDLDACTEGDSCNAGLCAGYRTSACGGCSTDCSAACATGDCCVETCTAGFCPDCDAGCSCDLTCIGTENCAVQCNPGSVCRFSATATPEHNDLACADATCTLQCTETGKHCRMGCTGDAVCVMDCVDVTRNCVTTCSDRSSCVMTCANNSRDCQLIADDTASGLIECIDVAGSCLPTCANPTTCTATLVACNRPCPP
jgi:hypothetical protein